MPRRPFGVALDAMMRLPVWIVLLGLFIIAAVPAVATYVLVSSAREGAVEEARMNTAESVRAEIEKERQRELQRECLVLKERIAKSRASDIFTLAYISNLNLDLTGIPLEPNTAFALAVTWAKAIETQALFIQTRVNATQPIECVDGRAIEQPVAPVDRTGAATTSVSTSTPSDGGGGGGGGGAPGAPGPPGPAGPAGDAGTPGAPGRTTPTTTCPTNPQGKCTGKP